MEGEFATIGGMRIVLFSGLRTATVVVAVAVVSANLFTSFTIMFVMFVASIIQCFSDTLHMFLFAIMLFFMILYSGGSISAI